MQVSEPQIEVPSGKKVPLCSVNAVGSVKSTMHLLGLIALHHCVPGCSNSVLGMQKDAKKLLAKIEAYPLAPAVPCIPDVVLKEDR